MEDGELKMESETGSDLGYGNGIHHNEALSILLAEDDPANRTITLRMLMKLGHNADTAVNGVEAVHALESRPYNLVLMDIQMPEMDGLQAARIIRKRWPEGPRIIFVTGCTARRDECIREGGSGFLSKPISLLELKEAISGEMC